ncbi:spore germination protein [Fictibacillus nanhaiensis]|uniref:spore germination protein n=1 Tax=Fictibacillus nanhaiensis TaxID=742169 RepID=UPI001C979001|nr:spore germination protein [Fictibacillus nanhaiensis]MBY6035020.1 spore germination protein [Fictibacillus nanhaiensis]
MNFLKSILTAKSAQKGSKETSLDTNILWEETGISDWKTGYIQTLINLERFDQEVLPFLQKNQSLSISEMFQQLPITNKKWCKNPDNQTINELILQGNIALVKRSSKDMIFVPIRKEQSLRQISVPEVEFSVIGPKEGFIEDIDTNLLLIQKRLPTSSLQIDFLEIGTRTKSKVAILYLKDVADEENVNTMKQRLSEIEYDHILDSSYLVQMIEDNKMSIFPQFIDTERPDRVVAALVEGKVAFLTNGSPHGTYGPVSLVEFFAAFDDYFLSWHIASLFRIMRIFAVIFSIFATPLYVAVITYHPELIPDDLMSTLTTSRTDIPFPPVLEALFLELTIELLREAGARLPTKVGQTIGIVGGIVIGTASVDAGLTSNVLLILVALSALASFTTPVYRMSNSIRIVRFPMIILSGIWGLLSVALGLMTILTHLLALTSLGRPYLAPIYPPRIKDWKDSFIRLPFFTQKERPKQLRVKEKEKINWWKKRDIDEFD